VLEVFWGRSRVVTVRHLCPVCAHLSRVKPGRPACPPWGGRSSGRVPVRVGGRTVCPCGRVMCGPVSWVCIREFGVVIRRSCPVPRPLRTSGPSLRRTPATCRATRVWVWGLPQPGQEPQRRRQALPAPGHRPPSPERRPGHLRRAFQPSQAPPVPGTATSVPRRPVTSPRAGSTVCRRQVLSGLINKYDQAT
jgi:hypothetical protein